MFTIILWVSLYNTGWPGARYRDRAGLQLRDPPVPAFQMLGFKVCDTMPSQTQLLQCLNIQSERVIIILAVL